MTPPDRRHFGFDRSHENMERVFSIKGRDASADRMGKQVVDIVRYNLSGANHEISRRSREAASRQKCNMAWKCEAECVESFDGGSASDQEASIS